MGRQGVVVSSRPAAAVQPVATMSPLPPRPPKKRYLMENPPRLGGLTEVSAPPAGDLTNRALPRTGDSAPPAANGFNGARHRQTDDMEPLNLTTSPTTEVRLSRIVDNVVEKMLTKAQGDSGRQGDPLRLWFTNQFERSQRPDGPPGARPQSASPRLAGAEPPPAAQPAAAGDAAAGSGVVEVTIGMSETISRVIDSVYRQEDAERRGAGAHGRRSPPSAPPPPPPVPPPPPPPPVPLRPAVVVMDSDADGGAARREGLRQEMDARRPASPELRPPPAARG
ncbi:WAS/WASL-interacting protein family member 3-like [Pollicipes pollicipes]|uniref:WAS/WASL-interacting protein family member 3-like n=1 Tax=Pollicipes pollicipes TaxID=41117 RepID=UPI001884E05D|nr:WAS/WASL-interacting protein family member 3-like [Pollicipes pollicipes]XP_037072709.1 WAS/WASL-interacting protein family member 3-like [Pollicipes pollicipes]